MIFLTIVVAIIVTSSIFLPLFLLTSSKISDNDLLNYAREYLSQYHGLVEAYYSLILTSSNSSSMSNFPLYLNYPNEIVGIISRTHGAVLFFNYSQTTGNVTEIEEIPNPVEYYLWPSMPANTSGLPWVLIKHADTDYVLDSPVQIPYGLLYVESGANLRYIGSGHAFDITGLGAITIFGSLVEENKMVLKGSNDKDEWSISQARLDSLSAFISDCKGVLNDSDIKTIQTTFECSFLLNRMLSLLSSGKYRDNPWLFTQDYEKLRNAGADNATLTKVETDYIEMQETPTPSLTDSIWAFFVEHILGGMIFGTVLGGLIVGLLLRRRTNNTKKTQNSERTQTSHRRARHGKH